MEYGEKTRFPGCFASSPYSEDASDEMDAVAAAAA